VALPLADIAASGLNPLLSEAVFSILPSFFAFRAPSTS